MDVADSRRAARGVAVRRARRARRGRKEWVNIAFGARRGASRAAASAASGRRTRAAMGGSECHATFSRRVHACGRPNVRARRRPPKRAAATRRADEASEPTSQTGACRRYGTIRRPL
ncbi:chemotaxis protein [Burkholderia sp. 117]|nr:chemotaxis protein [Burkholderia sp. 136(2017)]PNX18038.1 chemotaxis protein [Burkholderia sp. 129]PNX32305.1 chemotaxis protein [Burkholderia sp. 117]PNX41262.1 chemotaxis protein [Burkholderia sp. 137]